MEKYLAPTLLCDFYKLAHRAMYPTGTETVYSTWTPRTSRLNGVEAIVNMGTQAFLMKLNTIFNENFFNRPKAEVVAEFKRIIKFTLGDQNPHTAHIEELHDLGFLPLSVKSLPEGAIVPLRVPTLTIHNTDKRFFWLTNYIETLASCELWQMATSATLANEYRKMFETAAMETVGDISFVQFQGHDFSMRGMSSLQSAVNSGLGHLGAGFAGTDTVPSIQAAEYFYGANVEKELVGTSIPATEHSIQCAYGDDEAYLKRMMTEVHPFGPVSIVSDGYDYWDVIGRVVPALKDTIMARKGCPMGLDKVVIRPDSGDPVKIVCGDPEATDPLVRKGSIEALWDIFGGTITAKGYKQLDSHIGLIYGDAITPARAREIIRRLMEKGFASTNIVFGIGSYTYQYNTRDTLGFAMKSTLCVINGKEKAIFKDPKTDDGTKKSLKGRVVVMKGDKGYYAVDGFGLNDVIANDQLREVYRDGKLLSSCTLAEVRERIRKG
jgi:nicotinamide phosphoribosyltransferase